MRLAAAILVLFALGGAAFLELMGITWPRIRKVLAEVAGEKNVGTVVVETGQNQANVSKHLTLL